MCDLRETKLKGKGEVMFGEVVGRVSVVGEGRARKWRANEGRAREGSTREGVALLPSS